MSGKGGGGNIRRDYMLSCIPLCTLCHGLNAVARAVMSLNEDTYLNRIPFSITHALIGDLDPEDRWRQLFMAVERNSVDGPPLDPDFKDQLELCHLRRESPTAKLLNDLGHKGYRVHHLRIWLRAQGLMRAAALLEGGVNISHSVSLLACVLLPA